MLRYAMTLTFNLFTFANQVTGPGSFDENICLFRSSQAFALLKIEMQPTNRKILGFVAILKFMYVCFFNTWP